MSNAPPTSVLVKYDTRPLIIVRCSYTRSLDLNGVLDWYAKEYGFEREKLDAINIDEVTHPSAVHASATGVEVTEGMVQQSIMAYYAAIADAYDSQEDNAPPMSSDLRQAIGMRAALAAGLGNGRRDGQ
jgi:hypothetical protein